MTNEMIILGEQVRLAEEGKIKYLDTYSTIVVNGEEKRIQDIEQIHTYTRWKQLGFSVKRGQKAIAKFPIWKYTTKKNSTEQDSSNDTDSSDAKNSYCFMKMSAFFSASQVEPIAEQQYKAI